MISVDIRAPDLAMVPDFEALAARAGGNVLMHPAALCAAAAPGAAEIHVLQARENGALVGFWALRERRLAPWFPAVLAAPPYEYAFVGNPMIDPACDAMPALLDAIAHARALPKVIQLKLIDGGSESYRAM